MPTSAKMHAVGKRMAASSIEMSRSAKHAQDKDDTLRPGNAVADVSSDAAGPFAAPVGDTAQALGMVSHGAVPSHAGFIALQRTAGNSAASALMRSAQRQVTDTPAAVSPEHGTAPGSGPQPLSRLLLSPRADVSAAARVDPDGTAATHVQGPLQHVESLSVQRCDDDDFGFVTVEKPVEKPDEAPPGVDGNQPFIAPGQKKSVLENPAEFERWITKINPSHDEANCVRCAVLTELAFRGHLYEERAEVQGSVVGALAFLNERGIKTERQSGDRKKLSNAIRKEGSRAIVIGKWLRVPFISKGQGHAMNVVRREGHLVFFDGQTGETRWSWWLAAVFDFEEFIVTFIPDNPDYDPDAKLV